MKKRILFWGFTIFTGITLMAQHKRRVLLEEFTQASCGPCAENNPIFNALLLANAASVTPVKYQTPWPGTDPMYFQTAEDVNARIKYYNIPGVPDLIENGTRYTQAVATYSQERLQSAYNQNTPVSIALSHRLNAAFDTVYIDIAVKSEAALSGGNMRLHVAAMEAQISFSTPPGSNGETKFYSILRKMLPDAAGIFTGNFLAGEIKIYRLKWGIRNFYNLNQLETIAWLQDAQSKEVWQSARSQPNTVVPGGNYAKIILSSAAAQITSCENSLTPAITLKNLGAEEMTHATILTTVDNQPSTVYKWVGALHTNASTTVQLPKVTLETTGYHQLRFNVLETNQGVIINQVESGEKMTVNAFFESVSPAINEDFETTDFPPNGWGLKNERSGIGWSLFERAGAAGSSRSVLQNFYDLPLGRSVDILLPRSDFNTPAHWLLAFDHAYAQYEDPSNGIPPTNDRLQIDVSVNCGNTWTNVYDKYGMSLRTAPAQTAIFEPGSSHWMHNDVNLSAFKGQSNVLIRFRATSDYGNNLYLDNIGLIADVSGTQTGNSRHLLKITPNPAQNQIVLEYDPKGAAGMALLQIYGAAGNLMLTRSDILLQEKNNYINVDISILPPGYYCISVQTKTEKHLRSFIKTGP